MNVVAVPDAQLDVVVVAYQSSDRIARCVARAAQVPFGGRIVVVDHGSDGAGFVAARAGADVLVDPSNPGFGAGQNRGVAATSAPYLLLLNPDADLDPEGVIRGTEWLARHPKVAAAQGVIVNERSGDPERSQGRELGPWHLLARALRAKRLLRSRLVRALLRRTALVGDHIVRVPTEPTAVETLAATALLVRREAFLQVGGFDPGYFLYGEDLDLCRRLRASGWELVALPQRFASHVNGASSRSSSARELPWWRGTMRFAARWWGSRAWALAVVAASIEWGLMSVFDPAHARAAWSALVAAPRRDRAEFRRRAGSG
jgi:GT2 family glycosyltransferase